MSTANEQGQQPQLGLWDAVSVILGIIIGAGIYETPPLIFTQMPNAMLAYCVWGICGILALIGALCYAELATTYPRNGGDYVYLTRAYHPVVGYLFGWTQLAVIQTASIGLMAYVFADYGTRLYSLGEHSPLIYACGAVVGISLLNLAGVRLGRPVQNLLTLAKIVGLSLIVIAAAAFAHRGHIGGHELMVGQVSDIPKEGGIIRVAADPGYTDYDEELEEPIVNFEFRVNEGEEPKTKLRINFSDTIPERGKDVPVILDHFARYKHVVIEYNRNDPEHTALLIRNVKTTMNLNELMFAMVLVFLTYGGWNDAAFVAAEVRDPGRNIPRALVLGTLGVTAIYLLINWAYIRALGWEAAQDSHAIAADVLNLLPGGFGEQLICVLVMISALGAVHGLTYTSSRIYATMGADYHLFAALGRRNPTTGAPTVSLLIQMIICLGMVLGVSRLTGTQSAFEMALDAVGLGANLEKPRGGFEMLLKCTAPVFWLFFLLTALSVILLRIRDRDIERPFRVPVFPILPLIFIATCGYMFYSGLNYAGNLGYVGGALVLVGLPFFVLSGRTPPPEPQPATIPPEAPETGIAPGEPPVSPA